MPHLRTIQRSNAVARKILALSAAGLAPSNIEKATGHGIELVRRVLKGESAFLRYDHVDLTGVPTISDEAFTDIQQTSWPRDEAKATEEIYAAAAAIRELRPRYPVGCSPVEADVTRVALGPERRVVRARE